MNILGCADNDVIRGDINARLIDMVLMDFDAGKGNDSIQVSYREIATTAPATQPLHIHVLGGDGNDELALQVATRRRSALRDLVLDGGAGVDNYTATSNVRVRRGEDERSSRKRRRRSD